MSKTGKVYLVGAGPGDPGLITCRGRRLLEICDTVIYDRLASEGLLDYVKEGCEKIYVGKAAGSHSMKQEEINRLLVEKAFTSSLVVRLKGGDPYVFGRGGEEAAALREQGIPYEVVPGVTSAVAAAAYAGIPVTHRGVSQSFHVVTGHTAGETSDIPEGFQNLAKLEGTLVILMGLGNLDRIREELLSGGKSPNTPAAVISNAAVPEQKEVRGTLEDIGRKTEAAGIVAPAVIIIGAAAALDLRPAGREALTGIRIGTTGTRKITDKLSGLLESLGARIEVISTLEIVEYKNNFIFERALKSLEQYRWVVFTSTNAVTVFFDQLRKLQIDYRRLAHLKFAVLGSGTKQALLQQGFQADLMPEEYNGRSLALELCGAVKEEERLLLPRAEQGFEELADTLRLGNKTFDDIKIYDVGEAGGSFRNIKELEERFDYLTFASASGVHAFFGGLAAQPGERLLKTKLVCIGEATRSALKEYGYDKVLVAGEASIKGLADRICEDVITAENR
jgi:uroporphyrinogen III methyltransferase/synthase